MTVMGVAPQPAGGVPAHMTTGAIPGAGAASGSSAIPAGATAPVWQPWVESTAQAQSALKTEITAALAEFTRMTAEAQRMLDTAQQIANSSTRALEQAAYAAWQRAQDEIALVNETVLGPAKAAYDRLVQQADDTLRARLSHTEHRYKQATSVMDYTKNLAH